jgi:hypothetical protein
MANNLIRGALAGAAGTTALNAATYLDMALRGRPGSSTPEDTVGKAEDLTGVALSSDGKDSEAAAGRRSGLGALLGIVTGVATGAVYGALRPRLDRVPLPLLGLAAGLGANVAGTAPMAALGITDPRSWPASSWISDLLPHLAYGAVTALALEQMVPRGRLRAVAGSTISRLRTPA